MKNIIKIAVILVSLATLNNSCFAQRTISLRAFETLKNNYQNGNDTSDDGEDITYIKDIDNELDKFVGVWKGSINNRNYELSVIKRTSYKRYVDAEKNWDLLKVWVTVKDNIGNVIFTNTNKPEKSNGFSGDNFQTGTNIYRLNFTGNCYNDSGNAFLSINQTTGKMRLQYNILPDIKSDDCPNGFVPVLPTNDEGVTLTKQTAVE
ncbi:MAG: hypothetical protein EOO47_22685 [Flavobacterium sp.]|nr:MAG: hypothetical protein EOO47_22685 [Flavobacterium sp.]